MSDNMDGCRTICTDEFLRRIRSPGTFILKCFSVSSYTNKRLMINETEIACESTFYHNG